MYPALEGSSPSLIEKTEERLAQPAQKTPALPCLHIRSNQIWRWGYCIIETPIDHICEPLRPRAARVPDVVVPFSRQSNCQKGKSHMVSNGSVPWYNRPPRPFPAKDWLRERYPFYTNLHSEIE
jgi:hypothetical protein